MPIIKLKNINLIVDTPLTYLSSDISSGVTSLPVNNITGFSANQALIIGTLGNQSAEIVTVSGSPSGNTITCANATLFAHASGTPVQVIQYNQVEFSTATTTSGSKTVLATVALAADSQSTNYIDNSGASGYYFGRFYNSISSTFSGYSSPIPVAGYGVLSARAVIDTALGEINKQTSEVLSDQFAFQQLDACQTEVIRELKRWSFMQAFDQIIGQVTTGMWSLPMPSNVDDQNTNKSIWYLRLGYETELTWVDKEKFDSFLTNVAYTTLSNNIAIGNTTITVANANDFQYEPTGTLQIGANMYSYTAITGNVFTIPASTTTNTAGQTVFSGATTGLPTYWTTYGGNIYWYPIIDATYNGLNMYGNYYIAQTRITSDSTNLVIPDPTVAVNYLCWKFLKKLNNGGETEESAAYQALYETRKTKMKDKEVLGRVFKLKPRFNNFAIQSFFDDSDNRNIRTGQFPNTGF